MRFFERYVGMGFWTVLNIGLKSLDFTLQASECWLSVCVAKGWSHLVECGRWIVEEAPGDDGRVLSVIDKSLQIFLIFPSTFF